MAVSYTEELQGMLEEVTLRGNPNKKDVAKICSVLFRINERLNEVESEAIDLTEELKVVSKELEVLKATAVKPSRSTKTKTTEE